MTETSPLLTFSRPPRNTPDADLAQWASLTGRIVPGVQARIVGETGDELPWDGRSVGEVQLRGATIAGTYFRAAAPDKFDDGWLRTGDLGVLHEGVDPAQGPAQGRHQERRGMDLHGRTRRMPCSSTRPSSRLL